MSTPHIDAPGARAASPVLSARSLVKRYGPTTALAGVDLAVHAGEVVGLVGANGAGKSTLIKILAGAEQPTAGEVLVDGVAVRLDGPTAALAAGIATVHQDVDAALVPTLTVAENLALPGLAAGGVRGSARSVAAAASRAAGAGFPVDLGARVGDLPTSAKQQVLIARALATGPRVLVLDEPTAALSAPEADRLLAAVRQLAAGGTGVVLISHHLAEVARVCDRVVALREGRVVGEFAEPYDPSALVRAILGDVAARRARLVGSTSAPRAAGAHAGPPSAGSPAPEAAPSVAASWSVVGASSAESSALAGSPDPGGSSGGTAAAGTGPLLVARGLRARPGSPAVDLEVRRGEVLGITGLLGAGKTELLEQLTGARPLTGTLTLDGRPFAPRHPADAVAAGIGFVPEDRVRAGEVSGWDVTRNVTLPALGRVRRRGLLDPRAERAAARDVIDALSIVCTGPRAALGSLSGGNRQKVVVGRWLAAGSRLLVLDEPFRGIDLGARADIAALLRGDGIEAAIVASSDPEEVLEVADRVLVLVDGAVAGEVRPGEVGPGGDLEAELVELMASAAQPEGVRR